jgi:hypothetical protein
MCLYAGLPARTTALACRCLLSSGSRVRILPGARGFTASDLGFVPLPCQIRSQSCGARPGQPGRAVVVAQVRPSPSKSHSSSGRNAAHCPGRPLRRQGRSLRSRRQGDGRKRLPLTSAAPAGLTARARPKARPERRAAHLRYDLEAGSADGPEVRGSHVTSGVRECRREDAFTLLLYVYKRQPDARELRPVKQSP